VSRPHAKHIPPQSGTEVEDSFGCHPASPEASLVGGICLWALVGMFGISAIVGLWNWIVTLVDGGTR
jgi:hypothetical protein